MRKMVVLFSFLVFFMVGCNNSIGPSSLLINPDVTHLHVGQSQVFHLSGLNGNNFRVFTNFHQGESICYYDCDPHAYGYVEKLGSGSLRYTLLKGKDPAKERVIQLDVYPVDSNDSKASALIYPN